jgi:hypothetical protein
MKVLDAIADALGIKGLLGDILNRAKDTLLGPANDFIGEVLPGYSISFSEDGIIGVTKPGGVFVTLTGLSGMEGSVVFAGLRVAFMLAESAPLKVLLVDNIETIDHTIRGRFVRAAMGLQKEGRIDNLVLAGVEAPGEAIDGLNLVEV